MAEKRGRQSAAALAVVREDTNLSRLPEPPSHLSPMQSQLWRIVVGTKPADWFTEDTHPILEAYCQHAASAQCLSEKISALEYSGEAFSEIEEYERLLKMRDRETKAAEARARSMRLTHQARWQPATAAAKSKDGGAQKRPWEQ